MENKLVVLKNEEPMTTSVIISNGVGKSHNSVIKLIRRYENDLNEFGTCRFEIQKSGGRPLELCYLNEQQTTLLMTLMRNNEIVLVFKKNLVKQFYGMKKVLAEIATRQKNTEWLEVRDKTKLLRKAETDTIKEFVEYAISQGSTHADTYYVNISKMQNKALFILEQRFDNIKQILTGQQLLMISAAEHIAETALKEGMEKQLPYKDIYKLAKERVERFADMIPKTPVPMREQDE